MTKLDLQAEITRIGLNIDKAAKKLGVTRTTFYKYMDKFETMEISPKVFEALGVTLELNSDFLKRYLDERKAAGFNNANYLFDFLQADSSWNIDNKYFKGNKIDNQAMVDILSEGLPQASYLALKVESQFMSPTINAGDIIVCEEVNSKYLTRPHDYYIYFINSESGFYLARLSKEKNNWLLGFDNGETVNFNSSDIIALYLVKRIYNAEEPGPKTFREIPSLFKD